MSNLDLSVAAIELRLQIARPSTQLPGSIGYSGDTRRDDGCLFGNDVPDECGIVRSVNTVMGDLLANAEALLVTRLEHVSLDDITCNPQPNPLNSQLGAHHHG